MRNKEKDAVEMARKRETILDAGFRLFSTHAIESVSMQTVADEAQVGIATLYRYYPTKLDLVIAISADQWNKVYTDFEGQIESKGVRKMTAAEQFSFYLDCFIYLYKFCPAMLRFNYDFNYYVANAGVTRAQLEENSKAVFAFSESFHDLWEAAQTDGTLRRDVSETELFSSSMHIMLAVATRYAAGLVYHASKPEDDVKELESLKKMILNEYVIGK